MDSNQYAEIDAYVASEEESIKDSIADGTIYYIKHTFPALEGEAKEYLNKAMADLRVRYAPYFKLWSAEQEKKNLGFALEQAKMYFESGQTEEYRAKVNELSAKIQSLEAQIEEYRNNLYGNSEQTKTM